MVCGLSDGALFILRILYNDRCVRVDRSYNSKLMEKNFRKQFPSLKIKYVIKQIKGRYITEIPKNDKKFYISDIKLALFALGSHESTDHPVIKGKIRKL